MKHLLALLLIFASISFARSTEERITTSTIGLKKPDVYEFFADSKVLRRYSTDSNLIPNLNVTPHDAATRVKKAVEKAYGFPLQNIMMQSVGAASLSNDVSRYIWYYHCYPQWINADGHAQQLPVLVLPSGKVLFPKKK